MPLAANEVRAQGEDLKEEEEEEDAPFRELPQGLLTCSMCECESPGLWRAVPHVRPCSGHSRSCFCAGGDQSDKALCATCIDKIEQTRCSVCSAELWRCPYCRGDVASWGRTEATMRLAALEANTYVDVPKEEAALLGLSPGTYRIPARRGASSLGHLWDLFDLERHIAERSSQPAHREGPVVPSSRVDPQFLPRAVGDLGGRPPPPRFDYSGASVPLFPPPQPPPWGAMAPAAVSFGGGAHGDNRRERW